MGAQFVSEPIVPVPGSMEPGAMSTGTPGLPREFSWRGEEYQVAAVLEEWRETGPCTHGGGEQYVRRHWFRVRTSSGQEMKLYFDRKQRSTREKKRRWWLHSLVEDGAKNSSEQ